MKITVIICTYNRCDSLRETLGSLTAQAMPEHTEYEVLVVDNNSSDRTREVVEEYEHRYPGRFRYLFEGRQGKSYALNLGIHESEGEIIVFTDDDVAAEPTWLCALGSPLLNRDWDGVGGRTLPEKGFVPPRWLPSAMPYGLAPLGVHDLGCQAHEMKNAPFGNNMAFRRSVFEKYGGFRTDLGPSAGSHAPQKSEDYEFGSRVLDAGGRLLYEPSAVVYHSVPDHRMQKKYFEEWWFDKAQADIHAFGVPRDLKRYVAGVPLYLVRRLIVHFVRWMISAEPGERFAHRLRMWGRMGEILECRRQAAQFKAQKECDVHS